MLHHISVQDLKKKQDNKDSFVLIDCREEDEFKFCKIKGAILVPLSQFKEKSKTLLSKDDEIVIYCHHGRRSLIACQYLKEQGYQSLSNVSGGIEAWSLEIDHKVVRY